MQTQENQTSPSHAVFMQLAGSKFITRALYWAAKLNLGDELAKGPRSTEELARATDTHEPSLYRVLRTLSVGGVVRELPGRKFELTPVGAHLKSGPGCLRNMALWLNDPRHDRAWDEMGHCLKTGEPAAEKAYGMPAFEYLQKTPDLGEIFNDAMTDVSSRNVEAVILTYDFSGITKLVDVGGGHGALLSAILLKHPHLSGALFDQPHVVEGARSKLKERGLSDRCEIVGGDFFKAVASGDAIIMSHIIHDWCDEKAELILKTCRTALPANGKLLLVETVVPGPNEFSPAKLLDLEMMVMVGGRERTEPEYRDLLARSGFQLSRIVPLPSGQSVLEATPA